MKPSSHSEILFAELQNHPRRSVVDFDPHEADEQCRTLRHTLLHRVLGIGERRPVRGEVVDRAAFPHYRREKVVIECEPGSWQTALLYWPAEAVRKPLPAIVLASGHGGSKSHGCNQLAAQIYARLGCAVLLADPIGEEERNEPYGLGLRGHREHFIVDRLNEAGRPFLGKVVADLRAGLDYLRQHPDIDPDRLGCAGSSMGGTTVQLLVAVETGIRAAVISSWSADYHCFHGDVGCCYRLPGLIRHANQADLMALAAPHCALLVCSGSDDEITPPHGLAEMGAALETWWKKRGAPERFRCSIEQGGGHRPYHLTLPGIRWMADHLAFETSVDFATQPTRTLREIYTEFGGSFSPLYNHERHHPGTRLPAWPLRMETADALRVLEEPLLQRLGLTRDDFTMSGYLKAQLIPSLEQIGPLPEGLEATPVSASQRANGALAVLAPAPDWFGKPIPGLPETPGFPEKWPLGYAECELHLFRKPAAALPVRQVEIVLGRSPGLCAPLPDAGDALVATVSLVTFNDNETLLGQPSLITNLFLVRRALRLLRTRFPSVEQWRLRSEIPRLGELVFFQESGLQELAVEASSAIERAVHGIGRAENIVPHSGGRLLWIDLLLGSLPRPISLFASYVHPEARDLLARSEVNFRA